MLIVTLNSGSTSVKLAAYQTAGGAQPARVARDHITAEEPDERRIIADFLAKYRLTPNAIAHRVVHGGTHFTAPARIDESVCRAIGELAELAPLHNPKALRWIEAARAVCGPTVVQVAAFDTAFFAHLPRVAAEYAVPARLGVEQDVRRYGFHGLAHEAMSARWAQLHPALAPGARLITLQLGGGCSIAAIARGVPVDTSMGFSPLEGLVMATRCGDIDAAVLPYLQRRLATSAEEIVDQLNRASGLQGVSGSSSSVSDLLADSSPQARFAVDLYCYRARKYIGAYLAVLGGCDGIVFGGGVGEHVPAVRERILGGMEWLGIELDVAVNRSAVGEETRISSSASRTAVHLIPVDEEQVLVGAALAASTS
jgi:acetate kinase